MKLNLIFARAANGVIGNDGALPWHLPEDLAHFKRTTMGQPVIMGRKTWDSLPPRFRPLPGRPNIVVTRSAGWSAPGALCAGSLAEAMDLCAGHQQAWVVGGAQLYHLAMPLASAAKVTEIEADFPGDVHAPQFGPQWHEVARQRHVSAAGQSYSFVTYQNTLRGD